MIRMLIVGDKRSILTLVNTALDMAPNISVVAALSGQEALHLLSFGPRYDVILIDSETFAEESYQIAAQIKSHKKSQPVIIMGHPVSEEALETLKPLVQTEELELPYSERSLLSKLQDVLHTNLLPPATLPHFTYRYVS